MTDINVLNGQRVAAGDLLLQIEDSTQQAALAQAKAQVTQVDAAENMARDQLVVAQASVAQAQAERGKLAVDLDNAQTLLERNVGPADDVRALEAAVTSADAALSATQAQVDLSRLQLEESIPAQRDTALAALEGAQAALDKTQVHAFSSGTVTQLAMSIGSPASSLILSPAMVIITDRDAHHPVRVTTGFSQVARATLYAVMQPAIATGQVVPGGTLREPNNGLVRGSILVYLELEHPEHAALALNGSGCLVQTYTNNLSGLFGHVISATGVVKAAGLRVKVWGSLVSCVGLAGGGAH